MSYVNLQQQTPINANSYKFPLTSSVQDPRIRLIRNVSKYPRLYKNEFLHTPSLYRNEKQQLWDIIAHESGFKNTNDAKCKWRHLINYLRQHLDNVAQKKIRRYIPSTGNPSDKYVQLTDWPYYSELEFVVPYVKYAASKQGSNTSNSLEISSSEIDLIIEGIEAEVEKKNKQKKHQTSENDLEQLNQHKKQTKEPKNNKLVADNVNDLSEDDEVLKEYFENMLKSTLKLTSFHQNRIKQQLLDCLKEQFNK